MGHDILRCPFCHNNVMEGHNDWKCDDCGAICNSSTKYIWEKAKDPIKQKPKYNNKIK